MVRVLNMFVVLYTMIQADYIMVKPASRPNPDGPYEGIKNQKKNQQQESNLTNQQDEFNAGVDKGGRVALWPCRAAPKMATPNVFTRGQSVPVEYQSNNQHAGYMEFNIFTNNGMYVKPVWGPQKAGAGFQRGGTTITIPKDLPSCGPADGCFIQLYFYSKEPRNYVTCSDFTIAGDTGSPTTAGVATATETGLTLTKRQETIANGTAPPGMQVVKPYDDAKFYETTSVNYEMPAFQSDNVPTSALTMWNLTAPGEVGSKSTLSKAQQEANKALRKTIVKLTQQGESHFRCYQQDKERPVFAAQAKGVKMMENKGKEDTFGYFPPAIASAYTANLTIKPTPGDLFKPAANQSTMQVLSDPQGREDTTTYIDLPDGCIDAVYAGVKSMIGVPATNENIDAARGKIRTTCQQQLAGYGYDCPGDTKTEAEKAAEEAKNKAEQAARDANKPKDTPTENPATDQASGVPLAPSTYTGAPTGLAPMNPELVNPALETLPVPATNTQAAGRARNTGAYSPYAEKSEVLKEDAALTKTTEAYAEIAKPSGSPTPAITAEAASTSPAVKGNGYKGKAAAPASESEPVTSPVVEAEDVKVNPYKSAAPLVTPTVDAGKDTGYKGTKPSPAVESLKEAKPTPTEPKPADVKPTPPTEAKPTPPTEAKPAEAKKSTAY